MMMIYGLLLAAGEGRRYGGDKLSQVLPGGMKVGVAAAHHLVAAVDRVVAVLRTESGPLARELEAAGCQITLATRAAEGMGSSIASGVAACPQAAGWIVGLADMPQVRPETITALVARLRAGADLVAPVHKGYRGHPVGLAARFRTELLALRGDIGARGILSAHWETIEWIMTNDSGVLIDIDVPEDLAQVGKGC